MIKKVIAGVVFAAIPLAAFAQDGTLERFLDSVYANIFEPIAIFLLGLATLVFFWGLIEFISGADNEDAVTRGKRHIGYGLIGLVIIISVWGIMGFICNTIGAC